jgi:hypothetical protein
VTRSGVFRPLMIVYLGQLFGNYCSSTKFTSTFFKVENRNYSRQKMGWAAFWATFLQTT